MLKRQLQLVSHDALHDAVDLLIEQLVLGLVIKRRVEKLHRDDRSEALTHIIPTDLGVLVFHQLVGFGIGVYDARQCGTEA